MLNINSIINKQYGIRLKKIKKNSNYYYLSSGNLWENLPHKKIISKKIIDAFND